MGRSKKGLLMRCRFRAFALLLVIAPLFAACSSSPPIIRGIELDRRPSATVPLAAQLAFVTDRPTTFFLEIDDGSGVRLVNPGMPPATEHIVPVLGMRPDTRHTVQVIVSARNGATASSLPLQVDTPPLPADFPPIELSMSDPARMEPGVTLFNLIHWPESGNDAAYGLLVALDERGEVVWYYRPDHGVGDARRLQNGNLLYMSGRAGHLYEIDMLGNVVAEWHSNRAPEDELGPGSVPVDTESFHHEAFETVSGNILTISSEIRAYEGYPTSATNAAAPKSTANVIGDVLVEFTRRGEIVREVKLLDVLDPYRVGYSSLGAGFWSPVYTEEYEYPLRDWAHTNAVASDASGRYALASLRAQDAVVKIDLETGEPLWILGHHDGWAPEFEDLLLEPVGDLLWPYHQHAPMFTPEGTILMFDNGNERAWPFQTRTPPSEAFSRAVEYRVDEDNMEVSQLWAYGGPGSEYFFSTFISDADWLPTTRNVLVTDGGKVTDPNAHHWARIVEVTHTTPAEKVFEIFIDDEAPEGWAVYRAERLASLYP